MVNHYYIRKLELTNFRNYKSSVFSFNQGSYVIHGNNGTGKTSLLEAISLLNVGKGLKNESLDNIVQHSQSYALVDSQIETSLGFWSLKTAIEKDGIKNKFSKKYLLDDKILAPKDLSNLLSCVWIIPQMDNFFLQDNSFKRKFFDRLIFNFDPSHLTRLNSYEKLLKERNKILSLYSNNNVWLDVIEEQLVSLGVSIIANRMDFINQLNQLLLSNSLYPMEIIFSGEIEELFHIHQFSLKVENIYKDKLKKSRSIDSAIGGTQIGAHKTKFTAREILKNSLAENLSTGEQKMLLLNIIIGFITLMKYSKKQNPILLLDELNVHLDAENTRHILEKMLSFNSQIFITTTNTEYYRNFQSKLNFFGL